MEDDSGIGCSVWLIPEKNNAKKITPIISSLSQKFGTPLFEPHITLAKGIKNTKKLPAQFKEFFKDVFPFELNITGINTDKHYFKCVFFEIEKTLLLNNLRKKADTYFDVVERVYTPHLSLLYSDISIEERSLAVHSITTDLKTLQIKKAKLYLTSGKIYEWKELASFSFKKNNI